MGEELAARELVAHGYTLVERNVRTPAGEVDLVARDGPWWVFAEVRCRRGTAFGRPEDSLTARKRAHMLAAAEAYLADHGLEDVPWRCDFLAIELTTGGELVRVELIANALGE
jgi:putative endonuclease